LKKEKKGIKIFLQNTYNLISASDIYTVARIKQKNLLQNLFLNGRGTWSSDQNQLKDETQSKDKKRQNKILLSWRRERRFA